MANNFYDPFAGKMVHKGGRSAHRLSQGKAATSAINARPTTNYGASGVQGSPGIRPTPSLSQPSGKPSGLDYLEANGPDRASVANRKKRMAAEHWASPVNPYGTRARKDMTSQVEADYNASREMANSARRTAILDSQTAEQKARNRLRTANEFDPLAAKKKRRGAVVGSNEDETT